MMRIGTAAISVVFSMTLPGTFLLASTGAQAQTATADIRMAQATQPLASEAQRRRPMRRVPIYPRGEEGPDGVSPRYFPGRNAVRECTASYVQEYRQSGAVIVPRMNCYWRRG